MWGVVGVCGALWGCEGRCESGGRCGDVRGVVRVLGIVRLYGDVWGIVGLCWALLGCVVHCGGLRGVVRVLGVVRVCGGVWGIVGV